MLMYAVSSASALVIISTLEQGIHVFQNKLLLMESWQVVH